MGNHSRGQSMDSIYRTEAFSDKKTLPRAPPSLLIIIWLLQQPCLMNMANDDYYLHLISRLREMKSLA